MSSELLPATCFALCLSCERVSQTSGAFGSFSRVETKKLTGSSAGTDGAGARWSVVASQGASWLGLSSCAHQIPGDKPSRLLPGSKDPAPGLGSHAEEGVLLGLHMRVSTSS